MRNPRAIFLCLLMAAALNLGACAGDDDDDGGGGGGGEAGGAGGGDAGGEGGGGGGGAGGGGGGGGVNPIDPDADGINDTDEGRAAATDTDTDGTADYLDTDSDGDGVLDADEAGDADLTTAPVDTDGDTTPDFRDLDADGDCRPDASEATVSPPQDTDADGRLDFRDRDSDGDGLKDQLEDANCSGARDGSETNPIAADTDADGADDLVEVAAGTDPLDVADNPAANGDQVLRAPYQGAAPSPTQLAFNTRIKQVDVYVLIDRSGSMSSEASALTTNLGLVMAALTCPPAGGGNVDTCVEDLWAGAGTIGYSGTGGLPYTHALDIQPSPSFAGVTTTEPSSGGTDEPTTFALWSTITGNGSATSGCATLATSPARANCVGSSAQNAGYPAFGAACFRQGALPLIVLATDEAPLDATGGTLKCPSWASTVRTALNLRSARVLGAYGSGSDVATIADLGTIATQTGALDGNNVAAPIVVSAADAAAHTAVGVAVQTAVNGLRMNYTATAVDDPLDAVDAVGAFVDHLVTAQLGTAACADGLTEADTNADTHADRYVSVLPKTGVCWNLVSKPNTTVAATTDPQLFRAYVKLVGESERDQRDVFFLVPPIDAG